MSICDIFQKNGIYSKIPCLRTKAVTETSPGGWRECVFSSRMSPGVDSRFGRLVVPSPLGTLPRTPPPAVSRSASPSPPTGPTFPAGLGAWPEVVAKSLCLEPQAGLPDLQAWVPSDASLLLPGATRMPWRSRGGEGRTITVPSVYFPLWPVITVCGLCTECGDLCGDSCGKVTPPRPGRAQPA